MPSRRPCPFRLAPLFDSDTTDERGRPDFPRYFFRAPDSRHFFVDWGDGATATAALLRAEAGRDPRDRSLRELVGDSSH
nr:hypothetical protein [Streptomyces sp. JV178]